MFYPTPFKGGSHFTEPGPMTAQRKYPNTVHALVSPTSQYEPFHRHGHPTRETRRPSDTKTSAQATERKQTAEKNIAAARSESVKDAHPDSERAVREEQKRCPSVAPPLSSQEFAAATAETPDAARAANPLAPSSH